MSLNKSRNYKSLSSVFREAGPPQTTPIHPSVHPPESLAFMVPYGPYPSQSTSPTASIDPARQHQDRQHLVAPDTCTVNLSNASIAFTLGLKPPNLLLSPSKQKAPKANRGSQNQTLAQVHPDAILSPLHFHSPALEVTICICDVLIDFAQQSLS